MEIATRASRRTLRGLTRPSAVFTTIRSPSSSAQTGVTWGEPSGMSVAMWAKFGSWNSFLTPSDSVAGMDDLLSKRSAWLYLSEPRGCGARGVLFQGLWAKGGGGKEQ